MKIGTLTLHLPFNYGNALQMFSLHRYLLEQGYDAEVLGHWYYPHRDEILGLHHAFKSFRGFVRLLLSCFSPLDVIQQFRREAKLVRWLGDNIKWSKETGVTGEFDPAKLQHDIVIAGSDQIWNPIHETSKFFLLASFPDSIKKIAYAASFGTDSFIDAEVEFYSKALARFSAISVREASAVKICMEKLGVETALVCDPTLLHTKTEWCKLLSVKLPEKPLDDFMVYLVSPDFRLKWREVARLAKETNAKVHFFAFQWSQNLPRISFRHPFKTFSDAIGLILSYIKMYIAGVRLHWSATPAEFVQCLANSKGIFTDSFHGMMFATIFEKKCNVVVGEHAERQQMSARLRDFTREFGSPEIITPQFSVESMRQLRITPQLESLIVLSKKWLHDSIGC